MLPYRSAKPFQGWFDAGMTLAKFYVQVWTESDHFTKKEYARKDEFYDMITDTFSRFLAELRSVSNAYEEKIASVENYLNENINDSTLTFNRSYYVLGIILEWIDNARGEKIRITDYYPRRLDNNKKYGTVEYEETTLAPFITQSGLFGINTFLYMYYHGILPVFSSLQPHSAHEGSYQTGHQMMYHDYQHFEGAVRLFFRAEPRDLFRRLYSSIILDNTTSEDEKKLMLFALYMGVHEISYSWRIFLASEEYYKENIRSIVEFQVDYLPLVETLENYETKYKHASAEEGKVYHSRHLCFPVAEAITAKDAQYERLLTLVITDFSLNSKVRYSIDGVDLYTKLYL